MSGIITTTTPFIDIDLLTEALDSLGIRYRKEGKRIILTDFNAVFVKQNSKVYTLESYHYFGQKELLEQIESAYRKAEKRRQEELERLRREARINEARNKIDSLLRQEANRQKRLMELEQQEAERKRKLEEYKQEQIKKIKEIAKKEGYTVIKKEVKGKIKIILRRTS